MLHQMPADIVGDDGMRDAVLTKLERGERGALIARPRFVDEDMDRNSPVMRRIDRRCRGAEIDGREPSGIAMGQDVDALAWRLACRNRLDQGQPMQSDRLVDGDILVADRSGTPIGRFHRAAPAGDGEPPLTPGPAPI